MADKKLEQVILGLMKADLKTRPHFINVKRQLSNQQHLAPPRNSDLLKVYQKLLKSKKIKASPLLERFLLKREIRTLSGVAVITVLTKPYPCPGNCIFCPGQKGMPKSYLSNEPAVMRAIGSQFDPFKQVTVRLKALAQNGHATDKIELIVLGGSWSAYPKRYQAWFIKRCFDALNGKTSTTLNQAQIRNQTAAKRCVGLTLETRPDLINLPEIKRLRMLGCTRVELGVQTTDDEVLKLNRRGNTTAEIVQATRLLKSAGFKIQYHMMPNLPGSTPAKDLKMFIDLFTKPQFQPDMLKIYPCVVTRDALLYHWHRQKKFKPYTDSQLKKLLIKIKQVIPYYVRITRLIRDIPAESIIAGNKITNLRQLINEEIKDTPQACKCIRCREAKNQPADLKQVKMFTQQYEASNGAEYFISFESANRKIIYAFVRLRLPQPVTSQNNQFYRVFPELKNAALIRELHTYGQLAPLGQAGEVQHLGFGKKLMAQAEIIAKQKQFTKIAVISGIGVRPYYQKIGYRLKGTYMLKNLS
ncbi:MAG: tRNA uridine(34) 5-carboxymethylaminomethyl modification radical SAM/GNAT enzyme Elp3 [Patescibacteria group bacterium]|jgi:elongator complex protein 3|nr:tRNA uridine(34) 5-carboxymethylaminomethyl modification radical SAM/GNAT enzyme Elp3 [Patescibacteria group bacterium]